MARAIDLARVARRGVVIGLLLASGAARAGCDRAGFVVAIDPGHTRASPGATSARGIQEVRFNEVLARQVLSSLQVAGFSAVFLTNRHQAPIALHDRAQRANQRGANLFVSIHHDSAQPHLLSHWIHRGRSLLYTDDIRGHSLFVSKKNGDAAGSLRFARVAGRDGYARAASYPRCTMRRRSRAKAGNCSTNGWASIVSTSWWC